MSAPATTTSSPYAMSLAAAAAYVGLPYGTVYAAAKSGDLPGKRNGTRWVIRRADLEAWIDRLPDHDKDN